MATPKFDRDRAIRVVVDATLLGDRTACEKWKISEKTLRRYRDRLGDAPELSKAVHEKAKQDDLEWGAQRRSFLAEGIAQLRRLAPQATVQDFHALAGAIKVVGELTIVSEALGVGLRPDREGAAPQGDADEAGEVTGQPH